MQNFGIINETFKNILADSIVSKNEKGKRMFKNYVKTLKKNKVYRAQYHIYNKLENKIESDRIKSSEYVTESIKVLSNFGAKAIIEENNKLVSYLNKFGYEVTEDEYPLKKLHEAIHSLVVKPRTARNLDVITESTHYINDYINKNTKPIISESRDKFYHPHVLGQELFKRFNERYSGKLTESEKKIFKVATSGTEDDKKTLYVDLIRECIDLVDEQLKECTIEEKDRLLQVKDKLLRFKYDKDTFISEVVKIVKLKEIL